MRSRRSLAAAALALVLPLAACSGSGSAAQEQTAQVAATGPLITVYKTPTCGCCKKWVDHLEANGFQVTTVDQTDLAPVKHEHSVPAGLASCHTAVVDGYAVEGHVPAADILRLLAERPAVKGIAVPGMPMGSPGMEGPMKQDYEVYTFDETGPTGIFSAH